MALPRRTCVAAQENGLAFYADLEPPRDDFRADVISGLSKSPKSISPKYFYDKRGSEIFDDICRCEEYYVTRTEMALLKHIGPELRDLCGPGAVVVEFGSGSSWKIRTLLDSLETPAEYVALDISGEHLRQATEEIAADYPDIKVGAICADFTQGLDLPPEVGRGRRIGFFPGSTLGNFTRESAGRFLKAAHRLLAPGGALLIGVDLVKDEALLNAAYNDADGHTAAFNLNLLHRIRNELGGEVPIEAFEHLAFYDPQETRIEMHLKATRDLAIGLDGQSFPMKAGETIHTEWSHKYTVESFQALARGAGFAARRVWQDPRRLFSLHFLDTEGA